MVCWEIAHLVGKFHIVGTMYGVLNIRVMGLYIYVCMYVYIYVHIYIYAIEIYRMLSIWISERGPSGRGIATENGPVEIVDLPRK